MALGLKHGENRLVAYDANWPSLYRSESTKIKSACTDELLGIEHVGSTSVPNLDAKPIIDIVAGVRSLDVAERLLQPMQEIGYDFPGDIGIPDERIFGRDQNVRLFLVHLVRHEGERWRRYLAFRDALRNESALRQQYQELKYEIAHDNPQGRAIYTELKSEFINTVLNR